MRRRHVFLFILGLLTLCCSVSAEEGRDLTLNRLFGCDIFCENGGEISEQIFLHSGGWVEESRSGGRSSFRQYRRGENSSFETTVYSRNAVFLDGTLESVTVVFSNLGDSTENRVGVNLAVRKDYGNLEKGITSILGNGIPHVDKSGGIEERGRRWSYCGFDLFLTQEPSVYTRLRLSPSGEAIPKKVADSGIRLLNSQRLNKRINGDVILVDFPMIDQGEKGYCVPASWTRVLQFMGVNADMYSVGAATVSHAGGTDIFKAAAVGAEIARSGGRRVVFPLLKPTVREVASYIDKGLPILWTMRYSDEFAKLGHEVSGQDKGAVRGLKRVEGTPHVCVIIGYNLSTGEIAITDSWGRGYRERWYRDRDAQDVSLDKFYAVEY